MQDKTQSRKWLLTINNPSDHKMMHDDLKAILAKFKNLDYWCMCDEIGENKTYHTHLFIYKSVPIAFKTVKNRFPSAHIDFCRGTCKENRDYVRKEGKYADSLKAETNLRDTFEESGDMPNEQQGKRNDLSKLYDCIKAGLSNFEILEENPEYMLQLDKIDKCRQIIKAESFKNTFRHLDVYYYFGESDAGKTRYVMEKYGYENVFRVTNYKYPFDDYQGQDIIVFEEFRSSLPIKDMLNYLDGYPINLPSRYNNKVACYTKVYLITNISLQMQYTNIQLEESETWAAFKRRINKGVRQYKNGSYIDYTSVNDYLQSWNDCKEWEKENNEKNPFTEKKDESKSICDQEMTWEEMELFANAQKK